MPLILPAQTADSVLIEKMGFFIPPGKYDQGEVSFYYALDWGDTLVANFSTSKFQGTNIITISAYPSEEVLYFNNDFRELQGLKLYIYKKSVYRFSFATNADEEVHCYMGLWRIPGNAQRKDFNPHVEWVSKKDTIYRIFEETSLVGTDSILEPLLNIQQPINGKVVFEITFPDHTVAWYYWIGVGDRGLSLYRDADSKANEILSSNGNTAVDLAPFALYAFKGNNVFPFTNIGDNVKYWMFGDENKIEEFNASENFSYPELGTVTSDFAEMTYPLSGKYYLALSKAGTHKALVDVSVKIVALRVVEKYKTTREQRVQKVQTIKIPVMKE